MAESEIGVCEEILRSLPDWFGIEEAIVGYVKDLREPETWVAEGGGQVVGLLTLRERSADAAEIHLMAVREEWHGRGVGRALVARAEERCVELGATFLQVKTVAPSRPGAHYGRTRGFYESVGFRALEVNQMWGPANPCLIMVKGVRRHPGLELELLPGVFAMARLEAGSAVPEWVAGTELSVLTRTRDETAVLCDADSVPEGVRCETGFRGLRVRGQLEFTEVGILDALVAPLAAAGLSILALSTFDTDYVFVRDPDLDAATAALRKADHVISD